MTAMFDTLKFANKLKAAGISDKHAEAEAEALAEVLALNLKDLATKTDLRHLEERIDGKFTAIDGKFATVHNEIESLEERIDGRFAALEERIDGKFSIVHNDIKSLEERSDAKQARHTADMIKWFVTLLFAQAGLIIVVLKLLKLTT